MLSLLIVFVFTSCEPPGVKAVNYTTSIEKQIPGSDAVSTTAELQAHDVTIWTALDYRKTDATMPMCRTVAGDLLVELCYFNLPVTVPSFAEKPINYKQELQTKYTKRKHTIAYSMARIRQQSVPSIYMQITNNTTEIVRNYVKGYSMAE